MSADRMLQDEFEQQRLKKIEDEEKALMASLFREVETIKNKGNESEEDVDPKSILCQYFKQGLCTKGKKCKYSHDLSLDVANEKIDLYTDQRIQLFGNMQRDEDKDKEVDDCTKWDEKTLKEVISINE